MMRLRSVKVLVSLFFVGFATARADDATFAMASVAVSAPIVLPSSIPLRRDMQDLGIANGKIGLAVWCALALAALLWVVFMQRKRAEKARPAFPSAAFWFWRARVPSPGSPCVADRITLTSRHSLHVLQWHDIEYLLGCTDTEIRVLAQRALEPDHTTETVPMP